jgi:hypothetical protein
MSASVLTTEGLTYFISLLGKEVWSKQANRMFHVMSSFFFDKLKTRYV